MIALLRKDSPWIRICGVAGVVVLTIALLEEGFVGTWVLPPLQLAVLFKAGWLCGAMLGVSAITFDELIRTRDFLQHRPWSPRAMHAARVLGCGMVLAIWFSIPPLIVWAHQAVFGVNVDLGQPAQVTYVWLALVPSATATAIGLFALALPFSLLLRLLVGAAMLVTAFTLVADWSEPLSVHSIAALARSRRELCVLHLGATGAFLFASFIVVGSRRDADRPPRRSIFLWGSTSSTIALGLIASTLLGSLERREYERLSARYPQIRRMADEKYVLTKWVRPEEYLRVDEAHRVLRPLDRRGTEPVSWRRPERIRVQALRAPLFHRWESGHLFLDDGRLLAWKQDGRTGRCTVLRAGKGSADLPFTSGARSFPAPSGALAPGKWSEEFSICVHEPDSGELWALDETAGHFVAAPLPQADRLISFVRVEQEYRSGSSDVLIGAHGVYEFQRGRIVAASDRLRERALAYESETVRDQVLTDRDAMCPHVRVIGASGVTVFEHQFAPRTSEEQWSAARILGLSAARPPLLTVASFAFGSTEAPTHYLLDPLVMDGRRLWLVASTLAVGALCALVVLVRLRRFGADRFTLWTWALLSLALGPAALVASFLFERRRAWSRGPALETAREPRIVSNARPLEALA